MATEISIDHLNIPCLPPCDVGDTGDWRDVARLLSHQWPPQNNAEDGNYSGIDCHVLVLRRIFRALGPQQTKVAFEGFRHRNPLVDFASRDLRNTDKVLLARPVVASMLGAHLGGESPDGLSFMEIDEHELMRGTLWGDPAMQAFHESFVKLRGHTKYRHHSELEVDPSDLDDMRTSRSVFKWDTTVHQDLSSVMSRAGLRDMEGEGEHGTYTLYRRLPLITRILFDPRGNKLPNFSIHSIYRISFEHTERRKTGPKAEKYNWASPVTLSLIAVVRLRNTDAEHDYVRLYQDDGLEIVPAGPGTEYTSYHTNDWSVKDQDHRYMLYFAHDKPEPLSQVASEVASEVASKLLRVVPRVVPQYSGLPQDGLPTMSELLWSDYLQEEKEKCTSRGQSCATRSFVNEDNPSSCSTLSGITSRFAASKVSIGGETGRNVARFASFESNIHSLNLLASAASTNENMTDSVRRALVWLAAIIAHDPSVILLPFDSPTQSGGPQAGPVVLPLDVGRRGDIWAAFVGLQHFSQEAEIKTKEPQDLRYAVDPVEARQVLNRVDFWLGELALAKDTMAIERFSRADMATVDLELARAFIGNIGLLDKATDRLFEFSTERTITLRHGGRIDLNSAYHVTDRAILFVLFTRLERHGGEIGPRSLTFVPHTSVYHVLVQ